MPQRDRPARGPFGHGGAVDADPVGQVVLGPAEDEEFPVDPGPDGPAAELRRRLLKRCATAVVKPSSSSGESLRRNSPATFR